MRLKSACETRILRENRRGNEVNGAAPASPGKGPKAAVASDGRDVRDTDGKDVVMAGMVGVATVPLQRCP